MAIKGTGAVEREQSILMIQLNGIWYPIGEDNDTLDRTRNNTVTQTKNVLGRTKSKVTTGNQITPVSPFIIARDSALGKELYEIDRLSKQLDELKYRFMEVSIFDEIGNEKFAAWTQDAKIDLKSWGGTAADGVAAPFDIVWEGERTFGVFDRAENTFTADGGIGSLTVVSTAGTGTTGTILVVAPQLDTGNHYVYKGGTSAQTVTAGQDLSSWSALAVGTSVSVTGSPSVITVAEVDAAGKAVKAGSANAVYGGTASLSDDK